jgi:hypothetical protein
MDPGGEVLGLAEEEKVSVETGIPDVPWKGSGM